MDGYREGLSSRLTDSDHLATASCGEENSQYHLKPQAELNSPSLILFSLDKPFPRLY